MTKEQEFDERLVAKIIAAAESSGALIRPAPSRHEMRFGVGVKNEHYVADGPVCAIGAGVLYRGVSQSLDLPDEDFMKMHRVSYAYVCGVSDGFECDSGTIEYIYRGGADYARGVAVGEAVRAYAEDAQ